MSAWGTGIKQSDEFVDVYEEFFDMYHDDATATDIYKNILKEYQSEFSDDNSTPILYTVYYALAQCLWECGEKDEWLWAKIQSIIDSDADLKFWNELGEDPSLVKSRRRELIKFWRKIQTASTRIRKPSKTKKKLEPTLHKGDIFAYANGNGYRSALVLDYLWDSFLICIAEETFNQIPTEEEVMKSHTHTVAWFPARTVVPKKNRFVISHLSITKTYNNRAGLLFSDKIVGCSSVGKKEFFFDLESAKICMERNRIGRYVIRELINPEILPKYNDKIRVELL